MISRREFLQASVAASALYGVSGFGNWSKLAAQQALTQDDLLRFDTFGNVSLIHVTDIHAQLKPIWFREPEFNFGVGEVRGQPPHVVGNDFIRMFNLTPGSRDAYALTYEDFVALGRSYGRMGGLDRVATVVKAIRADRPEAIILDGGDTWHGSMSSYLSRGQDMVNVMNALGTEAMTSHWEWTFGTDRVMELVDQLNFPFLGQNIFDVEWDEHFEDFPSYTWFDRGGAKVAVIGQAFPYTPIANPRWMFPKLSFGIREEQVQKHVDDARAKGAQLVV
ncbi:MAG: thiosulfohydrolase SoxB, partial [Rhodobacteraceae bacterium]|nr:thiosulfohydrolase SoxB [Paracoccaceae bacterium]